MIGTGTKKAASNSPWIAHIRKVMAERKVNYRDAMIIGKETYTKVIRGRHRSKEELANMPRANRIAREERQAKSEAKEAREANRRAVEAPKAESKAKAEEKTVEQEQKEWDEMMREWDAEENIVEEKKQDKPVFTINKKERTSKLIRTLRPGFTYACPYGDGVFRNKEDLRVHIKKHKFETPEVFNQALSKMGSTFFARNEGEMKAYFSRNENERDIIIRNMNHYTADEPIEYQTNSGNLKYPLQVYSPDGKLYV